MLEMLLLCRTKNDFSYFGEVMPTNAEFAAMFGVTTGALINEGTPWFKLTHNGAALLMPKKPIRQGISWIDLYLAGLVYGVDGVGKYPYTTQVNQLRTIEIAGKTYKARLMKGADSDSYAYNNYNVNDPVGSRNSEYTEIIKPLIDGTVANFTSADLGMRTASGYGLAMWCQERHNYSGSGTYRVVRGHMSNLPLSFGAGIWTATTTVWRPYTGINLLICFTKIPRE